MGEIREDRERNTYGSLIWNMMGGNEGLSKIQRCPHMIMLKIAWTMAQSI
jgi:hypothetical protein